MSDCEEVELDDTPSTLVPVEGREVSHVWIDRTPKRMEQYEIDRDNGLFLGMPPGFGGGT